MHAVEVMQQVFELVNMLLQVPLMFSILLPVEDLGLLDVTPQLSFQALLSFRVRSARVFQCCDG